MDGSPAGGLLGIACCLAASAFFSASETALTTLGDTRTRQMIEEGGHKSLKLWRDRHLEVLVSILIYNNIVNILASVLATSVTEHLLSGRASVFGVNPVAITVGAMSFLLLTFGEITPKTLAKANAVRLALPAIVILRPLCWVARPATSFFIMLSRSIGRLTGRSIDEVENIVNDEYIEFLVRNAQKEGSLSEERERLLHNVFRFTEVAAREVMVPRVDAAFVHVNTPFDELLNRIVSLGFSRFPVYDRNFDDIVGLVYARDFLRYVRDREKGEAFDLRKMLRTPRFVPETKPISEMLREMQLERVHMSVVVDEYGGVAGIVTLEDIIEQFFGDIRDEFDKEEDLIQPMPDGSWRVDAATPLDEIEKYFEVEIPELDDIDTVGGYIAVATGRVAETGMMIDAWGLRMTVTEGNARRIAWVRIERVVPPASGHTDDDGDG
jgi:CBS domain containing-hemolysin-like protein